MLTIRETIQQAKAHEEETGHLCSLLEKEIPKLHSAIRLPNENAANALVDFVTRYIEHVPDFVEAISNVTNEARVFDYAETFLRIAKDYFLNPPDIIEGHQGMDALMDEAYLAHRLMEEVNDRFISHCGAPLAPMDMTRSNLIIHHLIGEPFANELDMAVQYSVELCMGKEKVFAHTDFQNYLAEHRQHGWQKELNAWPCLAHDLDITLSFTEPNTRPEEKTAQHSKQPTPSSAAAESTSDLSSYISTPKGSLH